MIDYLFRCRTNYEEKKQLFLDSESNIKNNNKKQIEIGFNGDAQMHYLNTFKLTLPSLPVCLMVDYSNQKGNLIVD